MSMPGWYPDPAGGRGLFRYWDGATWSDRTTTDPAGTPNPDDRKASSGSRGWIIALVSILLVTILIAFLIIRSVGGGNAPGSGGGATADWNSSEPTVSAWDETSSPTPPPTGGSLITCPVTAASGRTTQRNDGLIRGGGLSIRSINGWTLQPLYLQWASDFNGQVKTIYPGWMSNIGVAALNNADGFVEPRLSAEQTMQCFASSGYYLDYTGRQDLIHEAVTIDGHSGWRIRSNIYVQKPELPQVKGDVVDVIVLDLGPGADHLGLFVSSVTIDDAQVQAQVDEVIASIAVI